MGQITYHHPIRLIKCDTVAGDTDIILAIRYFVIPESSQPFIFFVFLDSFSFFDWAENGRPSLLPVARTLSNEALVR